MRRVIENQRFEGFYDRDSGRLFSGLEFRRCLFEGCTLSVASEPALRSTIRDVVLTKCTQFGCSIMRAIVEDVVVDGLKTNEFFSWGAVFKHVVLKGRISGPISLQTNTLTKVTPPDTEEAFNRANRLFYKEEVDWALDISEAVFTGECDLRGIPARLIRRDPETQVVVTRRKALEGAWKDLDLSGTHWAIGGIGLLLHGEDPDCVLVAPKGARDFARLLEGLQLLRKAGVAEPD